MTDTVMLHRGFCVKSPPIASHRWHKRWCTLSIDEIPDVHIFYKKYNKDYKQSSNSNAASNDKTKRLVFSYYNAQADEERNKPRNKFIVDDSTVKDNLGGVRDYRFAIKIQLAPVYNNRILFLCFNEKDDHLLWLNSFTKYFEEIGRVDSLELVTEVEKFEPCVNTELQEELQRFRTTINMEREDKARKSIVSQSADDFETYSPSAPPTDEYTKF